MLCIADSTTDNIVIPFSWHAVGWQTSSTRGISPSVSFCFLELKEDAVWQSKESYLPAYLTCRWVIHFDKTKPGCPHLILCVVTPVDVTTAATWTQNRIQHVTHINTCEFKDMLCLYQKRLLSGSFSTESMKPKYTPKRHNIPCPWIAKALLQAIASN